MSLYSSLSQVLAPYAAKLNGLLTGWNGTTYSTPGEAVRQQISDLHVLIGDEPGTAIDASAIGYGEDSNVEDALDGLNERLDQYEDVFTGDVDESIQNWLDEHPEATTTVTDGSITEAKLADALKLKTVNGYITPEMYGAKGDGTTDNYTAIQRMLDTCPEQSVCVFNGTYYISSGLLITRPVNVYVYGRIVVNSTAEYAVRVYGIGPRRNTFRLNLAHNGTTQDVWETKSIIGLDVWASMENTFDISAEGFKTGIRLMAGNTTGDIVDCTYNKFFIRRIYNCQYAVYLTGMIGEDTLAAGTVAQNTFIGGRIGVQGSSYNWLGAEDTDDNCYWAVRSDLAHGRTNNNNTFLACSFEGFGTQTAPYDNRAKVSARMQSSMYLNCRYEGMTSIKYYGDAMTPTQFYGGYGLAEIMPDSTPSPVISRKTIIASYASPVVIKRSGTGDEYLEVRGSNNNIIYKATGTEFYIPTVCLIPDGKAYASGGASSALKLKFNYNSNYTPAAMVASAQRGDFLVSNYGHIVIKASYGTRIREIQPIYTTEPTDVNPGTMAFVNGRPQWYDGTKWVYADGTPVATA